MHVKPLLFSTHWLTPVPVDPKPLGVLQGKLSHTPLVASSVDT